jgi:hypothetical protein
VAVNYYGALSVQVGHLRDAVNAPVVHIICAWYCGSSVYGSTVPCESSMSPHFLHFLKNIFRKTQIIPGGIFSGLFFLNVPSELKAAYNYGCFAGHIDLFREKKFTLFEGTVVFSKRKYETRSTKAGNKKKKFYCSSLDVESHSLSKKDL